ncbi:hypothetical protein GGR57DRAFT_503364 [Xylariaceae sp. FL1272]|nr:hypothetical protein GGR57DRAFT_503364 [Xylariaceae sp. FL1272]
MAQHDATGWPLAQAGSSLEEPNAVSTDGGFPGHIGHNPGSYIEDPSNHVSQYGQQFGFAAGVDPYGQGAQGHGHFGGQHHPYSNMAFAVDNQPTFSHDIKPMRTSDSGGEPNLERQQPAHQYGHEHLDLHHQQYPNRDYYPESQHHFASNGFGHHPNWTEPAGIYGQIASPYQMNEAANYHGQTQTGQYQPSTNQTPDPHSYPAQVVGPVTSASTQSPAPRKETPVPLPLDPRTRRAFEASTAVGRSSLAGVAAPSVPSPEPAKLLGAKFIDRKPDPSSQDWKGVVGCPNLFIGTKSAPRWDVGRFSKRFIAGQSKNGGPVLPGRPNLPCEVLRDNLEPLLEALSASQEKLEAIKNDPGAQKEKERVEAEIRDLQRQMKALKAPTRTGRRSSVSDSESSDEEDPEEAEARRVDAEAREIMATPTRPAEPLKGIEWDVVKIVRKEHHTQQTLTSPAETEETTSKLIGQRVAEFGKYVIELSAQARSLREQKAKAPKTKSAQLQSSIDQKYDHIRAALKAASVYADAETLRNMGKHVRLMSSLQSVLNRQFIAKNYSGPVSLAILMFLSQASWMDLAIFEQVKLSQILEKYGNELDRKGKDLAAEIADNAREATAKDSAAKSKTSSQAKPQATDASKAIKPVSIAKTTPVPIKNTPLIISKTSATLQKPQATQSSSNAALDASRKETKAYTGLLSARKASNGAAKAAIGISPSKRLRDDDGDSRAAKKVATETTVSSLSNTRVASTPNAANLAASTASSGQNRQKPSGSTILNKARTVSKPQPRRVEAPSSVSSKIGGLLADIEKPAEIKPKPQKEPTKAPETEAEKARRLRKESRRGRTVTWKPDNELEQIRFFEHDSAEDEGRASNFTRDAHDNRQEGQMLKQMQQRSMQEVNDGEDDDDDGIPEETSLRQWVAPQLIDFSCLGQSQRNKNYTTRGGVRPIESAQKKVMEEYENRELMTIYTTLSEIPPTPRSPTTKGASEPYIPPKVRHWAATDQKTGEIQRRWMEWMNRGPKGSLPYIISRLPVSANSTGASTIPRLMTKQEREITVLNLLQSSAMKNYTDPDPNPAPAQHKPCDDPVQQKAWETLTAITTQLKDVPTPPVEPPKWLQSDPRRVDEWIAGHRADLAAKKKKEAQEAMHEQWYTQLTGKPGLYNNVQANAPTYQPQVPVQQQQHVQTQPHGSPANAFAYQSQVPSQQYQAQAQAYHPQQVPIDAILQEVAAIQNPQATQNISQPTPAPAQPGLKLESVLAALGPSAQQPTSQTPSSQPSTEASNYWQAWGGYGAANQAHLYGAQQTQPYGAAYQAQAYGAQQTQPHDGASGEDSSYGSQVGYQSQGQSRDNTDRGGRKDFNRGAKDFNKGINRALIGTKACTFWAQGKCAKGDNCTFRHDPNDLK